MSEPAFLIQKEGRKESPGIPRQDLGAGPAGACIGKMGKREWLTRNGTAGKFLAKGPGRGGVKTRCRLFGGVRFTGYMVEISLPTLFVKNSRY